MYTLKNTALERLEESVKSRPDSTAVIYDPDSKMTFRELWQLSGKIYAWLKAKGIGYEDVVMYHLPRGLELYACMAGTMRAGAAFVLAETENDPGRTEYIREDSHCKLFVDESCFEEILDCAPLEGYEPVDLHALCYIAYTSGTTGHPKGVMHEYGSLDNAWKAAIIDGKPIMSEKDTMLNMSPINFVSLPIGFSYSCGHGCAIAVMPYEYQKNMESVYYYSDKADVSCGYLTPSFIRKNDPLKFSWHMCIISSEPADGLYIPGVDCYNCYASTESGCLLSVYKLPEAMSPAPVGRSYSDVKLTIVDDEGREVPRGEVGEICFITPYVRGYIHHQQRKGPDRQDGMFHTGDAGRIGTDGNMVVLGRIDEMFKIRGYRIEPDEVASAVKKVSGLSNVVIRGFVLGDISSIFAFYTGDSEVDEVSMYEVLQNELPEYMIPTNYVRLKEFPLLPSGKVDKLSLLPPEGSWERFKTGAVRPSLINKGRSLSLYDMGDGIVLKQFHSSIPYSMVLTELKRTRSAHACGLSVPIIYDITRSEDGYGILMKKLPGTCLEKLIAEKPEERSNLIDEFAGAVKLFHQTVVFDCDLPDSPEESLSYCNMLDETFCSQEEKALIRKVFECIPRRNTFIHGDCHPGNAIWDNGKIGFIDLMVAGKGHPVFDLLGMYSHYVFLPSFVSDEKYAETSGLTKDDAKAIYKRFLSTYYSEKDDTELSLINEWIRGAHAARLCLAPVLMPGVFSDEMLTEVKDRAVRFSQEFCSGDGVMPF